MTKRTSGAGLVLLGLVLLPAMLEAANCTISPVGVNFAVYNPLSTGADDSTGQVSVSCSYVGNGPPETVTYSIQLGAGSSGTFNPRRLASGAHLLVYNLFRDAGRAEIWGNGLGSTYALGSSLKVGPGAGNGTRSNTHTIYGRVPAGQDVEPGSYSDTVVITLAF